MLERFYFCDNEECDGELNFHEQTPDDISIAECGVCGRSFGESDLKWLKSYEDDPNWSESYSPCLSRS